MKDDLLDLVDFETAGRQLRGWRFEYEPDIIGEPVPWHYETIATDLVQDSCSVIDLATGGGETYANILTDALETLRSGLSPA